MKIQKYFKIILLSLIAMLILVIVGADGKDFFYLSIIIFYFLFLRGNKWIDFVNIVFFILIIELLFSMNSHFTNKNYEGMYFMILFILLPILNFSYIAIKGLYQKNSNISGLTFIIYIVLFIMLVVVVEYISKKSKISQRFEVFVTENITKTYSSDAQTKRNKCIEIKAYKYTIYLHPEYKIYFPFERTYISEEKKFLGSIKKCTDA